MPLTTLLISGPAGEGKTTVAEFVAGRVLRRRPHHLRLYRAADQHTNTVERLDQPAEPAWGAAWASRHRVTYTPERVFETIPEALRAVRQIDRRGFTIVEAESDPVIRHAYPYDYRIFVMAAPRDIWAVFREPAQAAAALQQVMQDTAAFASEIFGLFDARGIEDGTGGHRHSACESGSAGSPRQRAEHLDVGEDQLRQFLRSPLGAEIAARIQLQPEYHPLVEADVVVINTLPASSPAALETCISRIEKLLSRIRHDARQRSLLYWGNITSREDKVQPQLIDRLSQLLCRSPS